MKNTIILHGTSGNPDLFWFPAVKRFLEVKGYDVWVPQLPNTDTPNLEDWLTYVLSNGTFNSETILIGHSAGAQLIPTILEHLDVQIKQAILVSGYGIPLRETTAHPMDDPKRVFNWSKVKEKYGQITFINSDNDPWECNDTQGRKMLDELGDGVLVIPKGQGHMGSESYNQPYTEFPLLIKLIDWE